MNTTTILVAVLLATSCQSSTEDQKAPKQTSKAHVVHRIHGEDMLARGFPASTPSSPSSPHSGRTMATLDIVPSAIEIIDGQGQEELITNFNVSMNFGEFETATVSYQIINTHGETVTPWISLPAIDAANGETASQIVRITVDDGSYQVNGKVDLHWPNSNTPATFVDFMHFSAADGTLEGSSITAFIAGPADAPLLVGQPVE